ncbi:MAG: hypothetical protein ACXIVF_02540 [Rhizobiaceae bacterium]
MSDASSNLEYVMFDLTLRSVDLMRRSFSAALTEAVEEAGGEVLFDRKMYEDEAFQRCAAVRLRLGKGRQTIALVFLSKDGRQISLENAELSVHPMADEALAGRGSPAA